MGFGDAFVFISGPVVVLIIEEYDRMEDVRSEDAKLSIR